MVSQAGFFADSSMTFLRQHERVSRPEIGVMDIVDNSLNYREFKFSH
jgi:hypothetical protein